MHAVKLLSMPIAGTKYAWAYAMYGDNQLHAFSAGVINVTMYADLYPVWLLQNENDTKPLREFRYPREAILYARHLTKQRALRSKLQKQSQRSSRELLRCRRKQSSNSTM
ncbi:MAG: hypothetical protein AAB649_01890 [Patescibacteria group bacterium]